MEQDRQAGLPPKTGQCTLAALSPSDTQERWGAPPDASPSGSRCCSGVLRMESGQMRPNEEPESHLAFYSTCFLFQLLSNFNFLL